MPSNERNPGRKTMFHAQARPPGLLGKLLALVVGMVFLVAGLVFSIVIFAVIAGAGLAAWGYFWWKTRALRQAMRQQAARAHENVIDGEAIVVDEPESARSAIEDKQDR